MNKKILLMIVLALNILVASLNLYIRDQESVVDEKRTVLNADADEEQEVITTAVENKRERDETLDSEIEAYLSENNIDKESISYLIYDIEAEESYSLNEDVEFTAASVYKLPLAVIYYDLIRKGKVDLDDVYTVTSKDVEDTTSSFSYGTSSTVETYLHSMILYSDNNAAHVLFNQLGGWTKYKEKASEYTKNISENFYGDDNITTCATITDFLKLIYENQDDYATLISDMEQAEPGRYLDTSIQINMPQKYGMYGYALNAAGFVEAVHPYTIVVLTSLGSQGEQVMADINQIVYNHFNIE